MHGSLRRFALAVSTVSSVLAFASIADAQLPNIQVDPSEIDFGDVDLGNRETITVRVTNTGPGVLNIQSVGVVPTPPFSLPVPGSFPIPGGAFWLVDVSFDPTIAGQQNGAVGIRSNDPDQPFVQIPITGTGVAPPPPPPPPGPTPPPPPPPGPEPPPFGELGFTVIPIPNQVRVTPGRAARVVYRIQNTGDRLTVRGGAATVTLPDGSEVDLRMRSLERRIAAGQTIEVTESVLLPEAYYDAVTRAGSGSNREAELERVFEGQGPDGTREDQAVRVRIIPVGRLNADFDVTSIVIDYPPSGAVVPPGSELYARALVTGNGSGTAQGEFLVDGITVETVSFELTGGRRAKVDTMLSLPTLTPGTHRLELRIVEPRRIQSRPVRYFVPARTFERLRLTQPPGFRVYLRDGALPSWRWTPRATARGYEVAIDDRAPVRVRLPRYTLTSQVREELAAGQHDIRIRPMLGSGDAKRALDDDFIKDNFTLIDEPLAIDTTCNGLCRWSGVDGDGLFKVVVEDPRGRIVHQTITAQTAFSASNAGTSVSRATELRVRVEAKNDHGETVGRSQPATLRSEVKR